VEAVVDTRADAIKVKGSYSTKWVIIEQGKNTSYIYHKGRIAVNVNAVELPWVITFYDGRRNLVLSNKSSCNLTINRVSDHAVTSLTGSTTGVRSLHDIITPRKKYHCGLYAVVTLRMRLRVRWRNRSSIYRMGYSSLVTTSTTTLPLTVRNYQRRGEEGKDRRRNTLFFQKTLLALQNDTLII